MEKTPITECPFCADPSLIYGMSRGRVKKIKIEIPRGRGRARFWKRSVSRDPWDAEQRGEHLRIVHRNGSFEERWRGFTVGVYGFDSDEIIYPPRAEGRVWDEPPGPFFFVQSHAPVGDRMTRYRQFLFALITHEFSNVELSFHWWPTHGRQFKLLSSPETAADINEDIDIIADAMEFFRVEKRGEPKVSELDIVLTMRELGDSATQAKVAKELKINTRTLQRWVSRNGFQSWEEYKDRFRSVKAPKS